MRMEADLERNTIQLRTQQLDFEGRHDQHESKLVKEETSDKSLKEQLDSSTKSGRSSSHVNSNKPVSFSPRNMEVSPYSESTEAGVKKTLSVQLVDVKGIGRALNATHWYSRQGVSVTGVT